MITGVDVSKSFDDIKALDNANFHVDRGSIYGLVGPNGSGKSTLIRHVMGVFEPDEGEILVGGEPIFENIAVKDRMAYVPDEIMFGNSTTLWSVAKLYDGCYSRFDRDRMNRIMSVFSNVSDKKAFRKMSKGMQKQAALILALSCRPEVLVLDEPMDGLDPMARHNIWKIIMEAVAEEQMTVLVSSHNLRELEDVCDHVGIMDHGRIILEQSLDEMQASLTKVTLAYEAEETKPEFGEGIDILHDEAMGRMHTVILRGDRELIATRIRESEAVFSEYAPLTLEEIFIHELGGENDEIKNILF